MNGQTDIFDLMEPIRPGEYVTEHGRELTFDEATQMVGCVVIHDVSTESHQWFRSVRVEELIDTPDGRRLICYNGKAQRSLLDESYFRPHYTGRFPCRLYERSEHNGY